MKKILNKLKGILVILVIFLIPCIVKAETEESYIKYENIITDGKANNGWGGSIDELTFTMEDSPNYSFEIKGYNLEETETYVLSLTSDFVDYSKDYTGKELMEGINVSRNDGNGIMESKIYLKSNNEQLKTQVMFMDEESLVDKIYFKFNENFDSTEIDAHFKKIAPNGVIKLNTIAIKDFDFRETSIGSALSKYNTENLWVYGYCDENYENCTLNINDTTKIGRYKTFDVEYIFEEADQQILNKVNSHLKKFAKRKEDELVEDSLFVLEDLENINYKYAIIKHGKEDMTTINTVINYSSEVQKLLDYGNFTAILDTRAGWGEEFTAGGFGYLNLLYNGVIYGVANEVGVKQVNTIYIPNGTKDTREDYISAALKRVQEYLPNAKVTLEYADQISNIKMENGVVSIEEIVDIKKTLGEYYTLTIDGYSYSFFIVKDSSKIKNPEMNTVDLKTNIKINSDSHEVPLDAKINANVLDNNSNEYKEIMKKLNLTNGMSVDLKLYSGLTETYVTKLGNGKFMVYVPLEKEYQNKELKAYYIKEDNSVEVHDIEIKDGYAIFETDHFSTYTIGASTIENPNTSDNIISYIVITIISLLGVLFVIKYKTRRGY